MNDLLTVLKSANCKKKSELPTINEDEETLKALAEYGEKVLAQLSLAARWYARKLPESKENQTILEEILKIYEAAKTAAQWKLLACLKKFEESETKI